MWCGRVALVRLEAGRGTAGWLNQKSRRRAGARGTATRNRAPSALPPPRSTSRVALRCPQFMKGVAGEYEQLRQRQRAAMAEQMALDAESLRRLDEDKAVLPHVVSAPACLFSRLVSLEAGRTALLACPQQGATVKLCRPFADARVPDAQRSAWTGGAAGCASDRAGAHAQFKHRGPSCPAPPRRLPLPAAGVGCDAGGYGGARRKPLRGPARLAGHRRSHG